MIEWMGELVRGADPLPFGRVVAQLRANTRHIVGGIASQAVAAIENALLDVVGKALGVPVCALFGGPHRTELAVYWSHCGSFRIAHHRLLRSPHASSSSSPPALPHTPPLQSMEDLRGLCREVKQSGYTSLKTNILLFPESNNNNNNNNNGGGGGGDAAEAGAPAMAVGTPRIASAVPVSPAFALPAVAAGAKM